MQDFLETRFECPTTHHASRKQRANNAVPSVRAWDAGTSCCSADSSLPSFRCCSGDSAAGCTGSTVYSAGGAGTAGKRPDYDALQQVLLATAAHGSLGYVRIRSPQTECSACNTLTPVMQQRMLHREWHTVSAQTRPTGHCLCHTTLPLMRGRSGRPHVLLIVAPTVEGAVACLRRPVGPCCALWPRPTLLHGLPTERRSLPWRHCTGAGARHVLPRGDADGVLWEGAAIPLSMVSH